MMKLLDDLISGLDLNAEVKDIRLGTFHCGVLTRRCGLASSLTQDALKQHIEGESLVKEPGTLLGKTTKELVDLAYSDSLLEAAMGVAAINSLLHIDQSRCIELNAFELLAEKSRGKKIAIIGHFPFIPRLKNLAKDLWVIEKNPQAGDYGEDQNEKLIPQADVVGITGTAITNHSIEQLLALCSPKAYVMVLGDSAPLSPVLFDYGIDAISGTRVDNAQLALDCICQGATYRQIKGISKLILL